MNRPRSLTVCLFPVRSDVMYNIRAARRLAWLRSDRVEANMFAPRNAADNRGVIVGKDGRDAERVTTTLSKRQKAELERVADARGVKVAWLVRRAVERFLDDASGGPMLPLDLERFENAKR